MEHYTLFELNQIIKNTLSAHMAPSYWVVAEIGEMREHSRGHCYLDLVEKEGNNIHAKMRATIWSYTYRQLKGWFEGITKQSLQPGMEVLVNVEIQFHEVYGLSLNIKDIDANYTLGQRARKKQEVINQLTEEGVFEMNKMQTLPLVPQRIAVISSPSAAGYEDFMNQLDHNNFGYAFHIKLYKALMQGGQAGESIIQALHAVNNALESGNEAFDALVIIRGGGASVDLDCFDTYEVAAHVAQFPLPVITGIGHERDETVTDQVAHTKMKTPTAVAEFLINGMAVFEEKIDRHFDLIQKFSQNLLKENQYHLRNMVQQLRFGINKTLEKQHKHLDQLHHHLQYNTKHKINNQRHKLENLNEKLNRLPKLMLHHHQEKIKNLEQNLRLLDPERVLQRGYTITYVNGSPLNSQTTPVHGDTVTTKSLHYQLQSKLEIITKKVENE